MLTILFNEKRCVGCKYCVQVCPRNCFGFNDSKHKAEIILPLNCLNCRACEINCEGDAIRIEKQILKNFLSQLI
ncbi:MAG: 4Fe-4S dicluster domain-containing protein [Candidatus Heimdallarchaeota archaeon]|nr:4Fe-4S dicluster domain-containing protein [Candidatus Heimdallarchaeota archaeon]